MVDVFSLPWWEGQSSKVRQPVTWHPQTDTGSHHCWKIYTVACFPSSFPFHRIPVPEVGEMGSGGAAHIQGGSALPCFHLWETWLSVRTQSWQLWRSLGAKPNSFRSPSWKHLEVCSMLQTLLVVVQDVDPTITPTFQTTGWRKETWSGKKNNVHQLFLKDALRGFSGPPPYIRPWLGSSHLASPGSKKDEESSSYFWRPYALPNFSFHRGSKTWKDKWIWMLAPHFQWMVYPLISPSFPTSEMQSHAEKKKL